LSKERAREVWRLSLPIIGGMTSQNLLNLVDAWMVGGLGPAALAGTGLASMAAAHASPHATKAHAAFAGLMASPGDRPST
jgi:hypothetical protein